MANNAKSDHRWRLILLMATMANTVYIIRQSPFLMRTKPFYVACHNVDPWPADLMLLIPCWSQQFHVHGVTHGKP